MKTSFLPLVTAVFIAASIHLTPGAYAFKPGLEAGTNREAIDAMQGKPAPALSVKNWLNSKPLTPDDLKGKIVVLDFWATWCGPCLAAVPHTNELQKKYANQGVVFIAVCAPKGGEKMEQTVKDRGIKYATALDTGKGDTFVAFKANSYPDYYIIDRKGNLRWGDLKNGDVEGAIKLLIAEKE
jgi:thiol-disulfide isomerase/thioredoxin